MEFAAKYDRAVIKTTLGDIEVKFYGDESPQTVDNFLRLADEKFYDGIAFHRVIKGFMIQGGDPLSKAEDWTNVPVGTGGPGYTLPAEIQLKNERGTIATARQGDQVNPQRQSSGSQFYINTVNNTSLDGGYTVFGKVINGMEIVDKIENIKTNPMEQPLEKIRIDSIELIEKQ
ncbi:MAG TPA: peptidylprolyl isomerase [Candidatus Moranbacteria bacterium]|nr:peptidylprolyl isomerase [Candidatus Moranbacteria bacterium]